MPTTFLYAAVGPDLTTYAIDLAAGTLTPTASVSLPANVQYAWPHASQPVLYVASSDGVGGTMHHLSAFTIDPGTGALAPHGPTTTLPARPIHLCTDIPSRHVLVAFNNPAMLRVYEIRPDATLGPEKSQPHPVDPGIFPHQIRITADNTLVILVARGNDPTASTPEDPGALKIFRYIDGILTPETTIAPNNGYGFGPRHLDFHPAGPWIYVSLERQNRLDMFERVGDAISPTPRFSTSLLANPATHHPHQHGGTVHIHPNGRTVCVANRGHASLSGGGDNTLAVFAINQTTGEPTPIQHAETHGIHCRTFHIDPSGTMLVAAHIAPATIDGTTIPAGMTVFRIAHDGRLHYLRRYPIETSSKTLFWMGMVTPPV